MRRSPSRVITPVRRFRRRTTLQPDRPTFAPSTGAVPGAAHVTRIISHPLPAHVREMRLHLSLAKMALPVAATLSLVLAAAVIFLPPGLKGEAGEGEASVPPAPRMIFPTVLESQVSHPAGVDWKEPSAAVAVGERFFVIDANNRIIETDGGGQAGRTLDGNSDPALKDAHLAALATDGSYLYAASNLAAAVLVVDPASGKVGRTISLPQESGDLEQPRPVGLATGANGNLYVSDGANRKLLILSSAGELIRSVRAHDPESKGLGFAAPGALAVDAQGNIFVLDIGDLRVVQLAPDGSFVREFGKAQPGQPVLSRPKGIAVDAKGDVLVSDALGANIKVYDGAGKYVGVIGREETGDWTAGSMLQSPAGLTVNGDRLVVADRLAGLFVFRLPS